MKIALVTGGFDPLHSGHLKYLRAARQLADRLVVGINSDEWLRRKKGRAFLPFTERVQLVGALRDVDQVISFTDDDNSGRDAIRKLRQDWPYAEIIFANGGDRTAENIPEMDVKDDKLKFAFGVGGNDKSNSSSWILEEWKAPKTERPWGYYRVIHEVESRVKVKELTVNAGQSLSMQRHKYRNEHWFVAQGVAHVMTIDMASTDAEDLGTYVAHQSLHINANQWHQLINHSQTQPLKVIEIQYGDSCEEDDIQRQ